MTVAGDYTKQIHINATRRRVFSTLTAPAEFGAWWAPATGSAATGGGVRLTFEGISDPLMLRVKQATPVAVIWEAEACAFLPEWVGTTLAFTLSPSGTGGCDLQFRHHGLVPRLECYQVCREGWNQYLPSLRDYIQTGTGNPYTQARLG